MLRGYNLRLEPRGVGAGAGSGRVARCETGARGAVRIAPGSSAATRTLDTRALAMRAVTKQCRKRSRHIAVYVNYNN